MSEPLTPVAVESTLRSLVTALTRAQQDLADARDSEVTAKHTYESRRRRAQLDPDRPRVERGGFTVAEFAAWVDDQCVTEREAYEIAEVARKSAEDHLRVTRDQGSIAQTLARSVQQAFSMAGAVER